MACIGEVNWETGQMIVDNFHEMDFGMDFMHHKQQEILMVDG